MRKFFCGSLKIRVHLTRLSIPVVAEEGRKLFLDAVADEAAVSVLYLKNFVSNIYDHSGLLEDVLLEILFTS